MTMLEGYVTEIKEAKGQEWSTTMKWNWRKAIDEESHSAFFIVYRSSVKGLHGDDIELLRFAALNVISSRFCIFLQIRSQSLFSDPFQFMYYFIIHFYMVLYSIVK